ncbi:hypothetical protein KJ068_24375 [bacterium]|nr:MAG: hypothetical protein EDS67_28250 [candidate division KSB1 bacterium]MCE7945718.1 hypothetical protein [Chlorobi bacterium CHB1]MCL4708308.1 hypothetical protein [bacterium]
MNARTSAAQTVRQNILLRLYQYYILDSLLIVKQSGFKALLRQRGPKFLAIIFVYYLVRDTLLYIVLPFCLARGLF